MSLREQLIVTDQESPQEEIISDDRIREILAEIFPQFYTGDFADAGKFSMRSAGQKLADAVPMRNEEIDLWQKHHQVLDKTLSAAQKENCSLGNFS